jgi:succinate dehydrogenase / fumarate reductase cytochrome b subunit
MAVKDTRPFYLNLFKIRLPVPGVVSIMHRISGVFLFLAIPFSVYLLELSLRDEAGFHQAVALLAQPLIKLGILVLLWALVHHLFAGIRFLLTDFEIGLDKNQSRLTAWLVIVAEGITLAAILWGACS